MSLVRKARNAVRALAQAYGTPAVKRRLWNAEFGGGRWNCLDSTAGDCIYPYLEKYSKQGSILDLGCGSGSTANELTGTAYASYVGVDISDVALQKARERSERNGRSAKNQFFQSDISTFEPSGRFDVVLFRDSLYYIPPRHIVATLERYATHLHETGVFLVRLTDGVEKYSWVTRLIEQRFAIVERGRFANPDALVIVFRA